MVDAEQDDLLERSIARVRDRQPLEEGYGPIDAVHASHAFELHLGHRLDLVDIFDTRIHYPDVGLAGVEDLPRGSQHQPGENRDLVRHQHCREGDPENEADVFGPIAEQDLQRHAIHSVLPRASSTRHRASERLAASRSMSHKVYAVIMVMDVYVVNTRLGPPLSSWRSPPGADPIGLGDSVGNRYSRALSESRSTAGEGLCNGAL